MTERSGRSHRGTIDTKGSNRPKRSAAGMSSDAALRSILWVAAITVPPVAIVFAHWAGASWPVSVGFGCLASLAVYLSSRQKTTEEKAAELGRGVVVSLILTIALTWIQHQGDIRDARSNLALSLSSSNSFPGIDLRKKNLNGFYLAGKKLDGADLEGAKLKGAVLRSSSLRGANLEGADLSGANLEGAFLQATPGGTPSNLQSARLDGARLVVAFLGGAKLRGVHLRAANLAGSDLRGADLRGADLRDAVLLGANLRLAVLAGTDLRGAVLGGDFRDANLGDVNLADARWDKKTVWPKGFKPEQAIANARKPIPSPPVPARLRVGVVKRVVDATSIELAD